MTRDEIVTALRCCAEGECHGCTIYNDKQSCQERVLDAAADRIEAQAKEIEKLRGQVPHWIPVEERLPENFRKVLCWGEYFRYGDFNGMFVNYALGYQNNGRWGGEVANGTNARALAWMPLPEPPKEK